MHELRPSPEVPETRWARQEGLRAGAVSPPLHISTLVPRSPPDFTEEHERTSEAQGANGRLPVSGSRPGPVPRIHAAGSRRGETFGGAEPRAHRDVYRARAPSAGRASEQAWDTETHRLGRGRQISATTRYLVLGPMQRVMVRGARDGGAFRISL